MAVAFELVADFLDNEQHAHECCSWLATRVQSASIDAFDIAIHAPFVAGYPYNQPTHFQVAVLPANVGYCVALDEAEERIPLDDFQLSQLGNHLYELLRAAPHFKLAMVGWDVDFLLDLHELNNGWASEIRDGSFKGLVVESSLLRQLPRSEFFVPFDDAHSWIPYDGSRASV